MTIERLEKANEINCEIKKKKEFLKAFDSIYVNTISATDFCEDKESTKLIFLSNEPKLSDMIREYIVNQISELEKQLEEL